MSTTRSKHMTTMSGHGDTGVSDEGDLGPSGLAPALARVVHIEAREVILSNSPLMPSRAGCAGDRGAVEGMRVLDVYEQGEDIVHLLQQPLPLQVGQLVAVDLDIDRRKRLARTHAACVLVRRTLGLRGIVVRSFEIAAGMAWLEIEEPVGDLDLSNMIEPGLTLDPCSSGNGHMVVECEGLVIDTALAPIARSSLDLGRAEVRTVAALEDGGAALEIVLVDAGGRWWR
jgi:hypothetical protein